MRMEGATRPRSGRRSGQRPASASTLPPVRVAWLPLNPPLRNIKERSSRNIDRIDRATTSSDKAPANEEIFDGR
jgi:hypothetical protein